MEAHFRDARESLELKLGRRVTQAEFARMIGEIEGRTWTTGTVSRWESGKQKPGPATVLAVTKILEASGTLTRMRVQELVRGRIAQAGSLRALAVQWKCSVQYLSDVARGRRNPGPLILEALRLEPVYQPKPEPKYRRR